MRTGPRPGGESGISTLHITSVIGTRPEAIKMAPVLSALAARPEIKTRLVVTGQHRDMLDGVLRLYGLVPDSDMDVMVHDQGLNGLTRAILKGLDAELFHWPADLMLVQGDTTTSMAAAMAAFYRGVPVGHVEAGLRTGQIGAPFPEEVNRRISGIIADLHFAPTDGARAHLLSENVPAERIFVTGNSGIDALLAAKECMKGDVPGLPIDAGKRLILVTGHRRENFGEGVRGICEALAELADRSDVEIIYSLHRNPHVDGPVRAMLSGHQNVRLVSPLDYLSFVNLLSRASIILTDSGGVQEEGPALGVPVLVMRDTTERPEAVEAGTARLVGTDPARIVMEVSRLLDDPLAHAAMARAINPYGDGKAAERIVGHILDWAEAKGRRAA